MRVLVAGSTGALGIPTVRALLDAGHDVVGLTRSAAKGRTLREMGAAPVLGDVFDAGAMKAIMHEVSPQGVVQLLNALPKRGPLRPRDIDSTNRLRIEGTKNLIEAAKTAGVRRYLVESMIFGYGYGHVGDSKVTEEESFGRPVSFAPAQPAIDGLNSLEDQVRGATEAGELEGIVLRYGLFYGPQVGSTQFMVSLLRKGVFILPGGGHAVGSSIHVEDGASAAVAALERAPAGEVYNVVDDRPASLREFAFCLSETLSLRAPKSVPMWAIRLMGSYASLMAKSTLRVSNAKIKTELGWEPRYPTYREGVRSLLDHDATSAKLRE